MDEVSKKEDGQLAKKLPAWLLNYSDNKPAELERAFMPYALVASENSPAPLKKYHIYVVDINIIEVTAPFRIVWFASRQMVREIVGKKYKNKAFAGGETDQFYNEGLDMISRVEPAQRRSYPLQEGEVALVYLESKNFTGFCTVECFRNIGDFWKVWFQSGYWSEGIYCEVPCEDFSNCTTSSKTSKGEYLSCWKNKNWESRKIDKEMAERIVLASNKYAKQVERFFAM